MSVNPWPYRGMLTLLGASAWSLGPSYTGDLGATLLWAFIGGMVAFGMSLYVIRE